MSQHGGNGAMPDGRSSATGGAGKLRPDGGLLARIAISATIVGAGLAIVFAVLFLAVVSLRHRSVEARNSQQVIATANRVQTLVIDRDAFAPDNRQYAPAPARSLDQGRRRHLLDDVLTPSGGFPATESEHGAHG